MYKQCQQVVQKEKDPSSRGVHVNSTEGDLSRATDLSLSQPGPALGFRISIFCLAAREHGLPPTKKKHVRVSCMGHHYTSSVVLSLHMLVGPACLVMPACMPAHLPPCLSACGHACVCVNECLYVCVCVGLFCAQLAYPVCWQGEVLEEFHGANF